MLSETNFFGPGEARAAWFQNMWQEYQALLKKGYDLRGFCWFPFVNSTDFQHLLLKNPNDIDPVGIYDLDTERHERIPTQLVSLIEQIASSSPESISG